MFTQGDVKRVLRLAKTAKSQAMERWNDLCAAPHPRPIFVLGNQKSGTTAIAALLAKMLGERYSHDMIYSRRWTDLEQILKGDVPVADLVKRAPSAFSAGVIKDPDFTFLFPSFRKAFPSAQFILIIRDPRDNIRSILNRLSFRGDLHDLRQAELSLLHSLPLWRAVFDRNIFFFRSKNYIETLAMRWNYCFERTVEIDDGIMIVRYEDFEADKLKFLTELAVRLGRPVTHSVRDQLDKQFQPAGRNDVDLLEFFGKKNLGVIENICFERMQKYGYDCILN